MPDDLADARLEAEIRRALDVCLVQTDRRVYRKAWLRLSSLIDRRSPEQVTRMERERGLR
jgi:hypothetical protein